MAASSQAKNFGTRLRWWRARRGLSQLALAGEAAVSQRHLSFLESGRTGPSQEMVLRLAAALDLPLRQQNALLLAAGFAPYWRESALGARELDQINRTLDIMLAQQDPFPAFVVDRRWNLMRANAGAARLTRFLNGAQPSEAATQGVNLACAASRPMPRPTEPGKPRTCCSACCRIPRCRRSPIRTGWTNQRDRC